MRLLVLLALAGCSTASLRAGGAVIGGKPAFQLSMEIGASFGESRLYDLTHENGMIATGAGVSYVNGVNASVVTLHEDRGPVARLGARMRASVEGASIGARGTFYTGMLRDAKSRSGGIGVDLGGGIPLDGSDLVIEASIVYTGKWRIQ